MIDNYKIMSTRYLKQNKKRTILTLIGIILSLSLIATIGLFVKSGEISQVENVKYEMGYSFHLSYKTYTDEILSKIDNNPNVERFGIMSLGERVPYNSILIEEYFMNKGATEFFKYSIKEGSMPQNNSEICIDEWGKDHIKEGLKIGDTLDVKGNQYKIVGFLKNDEYYQREKICRLITFSASPKNGQLMVEISPKADFEGTLKNLSNLTNKENLISNEPLIRINKLGSNKNLIVAAGIAITIVLCATIIVIYNSFQINVAERVKQFGLLRSIGATKKQIKNIVFREATVLLFIAIPIGLVISIGAIYSINFIFKLLLKESSPISLVTIDMGVLIISSIITILAVYISSLIPAHFVGNISPLVAVSSRVIIKKEVIKRRKYPLLKRIFNYKMLMAIKNIRRNPSRCQTMILSIVVSSVLFITFTSLMNQVFTIKSPSESYKILDLDVVKSSDDRDIQLNSNELTFDNLSKEIQRLSNVEKTYIKYKDVNTYIDIPLEKRIKEAGNIFQKQKVGDEYKKVLDTKVKSYDEEALQKINQYILSGEIDISRLNSENGIILVDNGKARDYNTNKLYIGKLTNYKVNDEIVIFKDNKEFKFKILGIIKDDIFERDDSPNVLELITSKQIAENILAESPEVQNLSVSLKDKSLNLKTTTEINNILNNNSSYSVINYVDINDTQKNSMIMIQVLVYGFISVIALISSINIINTITMNITLRRKEIAMLKSIGMSQKDLKTMIRYEGMFYGIFGGVIGSVIGCALSYSIFNVLSDVVSMQWKMPLGLSIITILVAMAISYLSTLIPMRKIEKYNVIEAIKEE
ncbi:ABC transporter permease [Clostridium weizhouense]|uniref:ABC transporter permease n=1 Tax=Clostridium weizhouense TaxID=2859781 RepID=A0ABS7ASE7_9CLOT|nr:ABC transporter permease [Clostridium weizhouense]MBW6411594.1 ABC transporter permease [Clostridium weizhouense]